jgi:RNA polymerase sigma-70 factor (ECF subfamily)
VRADERAPDEAAGEEDALVARARAGEHAAFEALVERHRDALFAQSLRLLNSTADAAEVTQEAFLTAYRGLDTLQAGARFAAWLHRIAANHALMRLRQRRSASRVEQEASEEELEASVDSAWMESAAWVRSAEQQVLDAEFRHLVEQATAALPDEYREAFVLRDMQHWSYEEIAAQTGISLAAVKSRLHRARLALRRALTAYYEGRA